MDFRERETDFQEADLRYAELNRQHEAGTISGEELDARLKEIMVQDAEDRWWAKSRKTGEWHYHDGSAWVRDTPPGYQQRPPTLPGEESTPDRQSQLEHDERLPASQTTFLGSMPTQDQNEGEKRRGVPRWAIIAAGLVGVVALAGIGIIATMGGEGSGPTPGYDLVKDDSGALSVEVPSEWDERLFVDEEGEKGRSAWSSFLDNGESAGPSMTAVNDLYSWRNGTPGHQGVYTVVSKSLAQRYTDEELVALGPNDYSSSCEAGTRRDFDRPPYSGRIQRWENCGGESDHNAITVAAAPEGRECVIVAQIGGYFRTQTDEENIQHVLDTFEADCGEI
jgi:hypothetical protein